MRDRTQITRPCRLSHKPIGVGFGVVFYSVAGQDGGGAAVVRCGRALSGPREVLLVLLLMVHG